MVKNSCYSYKIDYAKTSIYGVFIFMPRSTNVRGAHRFWSVSLSDCPYVSPPPPWAMFCARHIMVTNPPIWFFFCEGLFYFYFRQTIEDWDILENQFACARTGTEAWHSSFVFHSCSDYIRDVQLRVIF